MNKNDSFSVREGIVPPHSDQTGGLNMSTRLALHDTVTLILGEKREDLPHALVRIAHHFLELRREEIQSDHEISGRKDLWGITPYGPAVRYFTPRFNDGVESLFLKGEWHTVLDFIEVVYAEFGELAGRLPITSAKFSDDVNQIMETENVGYRLVMGEFQRSPLLDDSDREEVEKAAQVPFANAGAHVVKARAFLLDRKNPDYANSMKESISAVEALANELTGGKDKSLGACLTILEQKGYRLHPAFRDALDKLYGFTSDESGVRHGKRGEPVQTDEPTARFMLVTASAFVNYIVALSAKGGEGVE